MLFFDIVLLTYLYSWKKGIIHILVTSICFMFFQASQPFMYSQTSRFCIKHFYSKARHTCKLINYTQIIHLCCDTGQNDTIGKIELITLLILITTILIARMTFNSSLNCLMSFESMEITINTYRCW